MLKIAASPQKIKCPSIRGMSPVLETNMKKCHTLGIFRLSCAFYYEERKLKPVGTTPVHQDLNLICCIKKIYRCGKYRDVGQTRV